MTSPRILVGEDDAVIRGAVAAGSRRSRPWRPHDAVAGEQGALAAAMRLGPDLTATNVPLTPGRGAAAVPPAGTAARAGMMGTHQMARSVMVLNAGSSSLKFGLFKTSDPPGAKIEATAHGAVDDLDGAPHLLVRDQDGAVLADQTWSPGQPNPFDTVLEALLAVADAHVGPDGLAADWSAPLRVDRARRSD